MAYRGQRTTINELSPGTPLQENIKNNAWTKAIVTGSLGSSDSLKNFVRLEDWNKVHLIVKGNKLQHYVNDVLMSEVTDNDKINGKSSGLLGVQVHVGPPMRVEFRNIMFKKI